MVQLSQYLDLALVPSTGAASVEGAHAGSPPHRHRDRQLRKGVGHRAGSEGKGEGRTYQAHPAQVVHVVGATGCCLQLNVKIRQPAGSEGEDACRPTYGPPFPPSKAVVGGSKHKEGTILMQSH